MTSTSTTTIHFCMYFYIQTRNCCCISPHQCICQHPCQSNIQHIRIHHRVSVHEMGKCTTIIHVVHKGYQCINTLNYCMQVCGVGPFQISVLWCTHGLLSGSEGTALKKFCVISEIGLQRQHRNCPNSVLSLKSLTVGSHETALKITNKIFKFCERSDANHMYIPYVFMWNLHHVLQNIDMCFVVYMIQVWYSDALLQINMTSLQFRRQKYNQSIFLDGLLNL